MNENRRRIFLIMAAFLMMLAFIAAFLLYSFWSKNHIREQNVEQARDNTLLTAATISETTMSSREEIAVIADLYSAGARSPEEAESLFRAVVDSGIFDEFEATNEKGSAYGYAGRFAYVAGRDYFKRGMAGESGTVVVFGSYSGKTVTLSYAPAVYDGQTRGVLFGMHDAQKCYERVLTMTELNEQTRSLLCTADGYVFAGTGDTPAGTSVFYVEGLNDEISSALGVCAATRQTASIEMTDGMACCIVTPVEGTDWVLLQLYPDDCFSGRYRSATNGIVQLAFFLIVVFAMYLVFWFTFNRFETNQLKAEIADITSYRKAVQADALILLQVNLNTNELTEGEWMDRHRHSYSLHQLLSLRLPCSYDSYITRWNENYVREESKELFAEYTSRAYLMKSFSEGKSIVTFDYSARNLEGEDVYLRRTISMIRLEKTGEIIAYTSVKNVTAEVTERENRQKELTDALIRAGEMSDAADKFIEDIRRDVHLPADAALGYAAMCYNEADNPAAVKGYLEQIAAAGQHLLSVTDQPVNGENPENITDLMRLIKELGALLTPKLSAKGLNFAGDFGSAYERVVLCGKLNLSRVLMNLVTNLIERSRSDGSLCVSVRQTPAEEENCVRTRFVLMSGAETESADEQLKKQTLSDDGSPVGIAGKLVRDMGGTLAMTPEGGFRVELVLKIAPERAESVDERLRVIEQNNLSGARLLVVGGPDGDCARAKDELARLGFIIEEAADGRECLITLRGAEPGTYRAVLLPMNPGNGDAFALTREIRSGNNGRVPIIGIASATNEDERRMAYAGGMNAYLPAAIDGKALRSVISTVL